MIETIEKALEYPDHKGSWTVTTYLAIEVKTTRILWRCKRKSCKHTWAYEYRKAYSYMGARIGREYVPPAYDLYRTSDMHMKDHTDHICPECKASGIESIIKGKVTEKKCDARCTGAKGADCECSCGGHNHGKDYVISLSQRVGACRG